MNKHAGFTLIELLVVLALLAILLALAVPNFRTLVQNTRATSQANELLTMLQYARSEALKRGRPVSLCQSEDAATCSGDWEDGWIVYVDGNGAGAAATAVNELLRVWQALPQGTEVTVVNMPAANFLRYLPAGQIDPIPDPFPVTFQVRVDDCAGENGRDIAVARTGRVAVQRVAC